MHNNIHFYGERGIVNAIILDIYQKRNKVKDSLNRFFGEIKLMDRSVPPWKDKVKSCQWLMEPCLAEFGNPDFIAVIETESNQSYALFFEAKRDPYEKSSLRISADMLVLDEETAKKYVGQASKLNVQLALRYRFIEAYLREPTAEKIEEADASNPDGRRRRLHKPIVTTTIKEMFSEVKEINQFYFIGMTNDPSKALPWGDIKKEYYPPITTIEEHSGRFGLLTYSDLEKNGVISRKITRKTDGVDSKARKTCYASAVRMMNLNLPGTLKPKKATSKQVKRLNSINFENWSPTQLNLDQEFLKDDLKEYFKSPNKLAGSYSGLIDGKVELKLMANPDPDNTEQLWLGFREEDGIDTELTKKLFGQKKPTKFTVNNTEFFFYPVSESNVDQLRDLAFLYIDARFKQKNIEPSHP